METLRWSIERDRGTARFGRPPPFAGNTYTLVIEGSVAGETITAYVMSDDGLRCLARSGEGRIAFDTEALRDEFAREPHEARVFHCYFRNSEATIAEGDLTILWNPLWALDETDTATVYTMRGPKGDRGTTGATGATGATGKSAYEVAVANGYTGTADEWLASLKGEPGATATLQRLGTDGLVNNPAMWHRVFVQQDSAGKLAVAVNEVEEGGTGEQSLVLQASQGYVDNALTNFESTHNFQTINADGAFMIPVRKADGVQQFMKMGIYNLEGNWVPSLDNRFYALGADGTFEEVTG